MILEYSGLTMIYIYAIIHSGITSISFLVDNYCYTHYCETWHLFNIVV